MAALGMACLRLVLATVLVAHGIHKLFGGLAGQGQFPGGLAGTAAHFSGLGLEPALALAMVAGIVQLVGGGLIGLGWFTRWAAGANLAYLLVGLWVDHGRWGLFLNWTATPGIGHGMEYSIVLAGAMLCLLLAGPGDLSIDGRNARYQASRAAGRARLRRT